MANRIELITRSDASGTYGDGSVLNDENEILFEFKSLELPWRKNRKGVSCIPPEPGKTLDYLVEKNPPKPTRPYEYFRVMNVDGRSGILLHRGNYTRQIQGCILPGEHFKDLDKDGVPDITNTTETMNILVAIMPDKFKLIITRTR